MAKREAASEIPASLRDGDTMHRWCQHKSDKKDAPTKAKLASRDGSTQTDLAVKPSSSTRA